MKKCAQNGATWRKTSHFSITHLKTFLKENLLIPKSMQNLAEQLALKKYLLIKKEALSSELKAINLYLKHHKDYFEEPNKLLYEDSPYASLLAPYFQTPNTDLQQWTNQPYDCNPAYPEQRIHKTTSGIFVRSKSEALIAMLLHINQVPFRYESPLILDEITLYPDFTIRHPKTGATFYWEHFGMIEQTAYAKNAYSKLQLYTSHGIYPSIYLLATYETKEDPSLFFFSRSFSCSRSVVRDNANSSRRSNTWSGTFKLIGAKFQTASTP